MRHFRWQQVALYDDTQHWTVTKRSPCTKTQRARYERSTLNGAAAGSRSSGGKRSGAEWRWQTLISGAEEEITRRVCACGKSLLPRGRQRRRPLITTAPNGRGRRRPWNGNETNSAGPLGQSAPVGKMITTLHPWRSHIAPIDFHQPPSTALPVGGVCHRWNGCGTAKATATAAAAAARG